MHFEFGILVSKLEIRKPNFPFSVSNFKNLKKLIKYILQSKTTVMTFKIKGDIYTRNYEQK